MDSTRDYYRILQVHIGAARADIVASYRRLCKLYHPDLNRDPRAEEIMKDINLAYYILGDEVRRAEYNRVRFASRGQPAATAGFRSEWDRAARAEEEENKAALKAVLDYFGALQKDTLDAAYTLLSGYDRQYVTLQSFCKWRRSVNRLFSIRSFSAKVSGEPTHVTLEDGRRVPAKKAQINVTEKNLLSQATEQYQLTKYVVPDSGVWRVFLGYRDLNEIARMFENLSAEQERGEMARHWAEYCNDTCRGLDMLSLAGLLKASKRELYRSARYNQPLTVVCFSAYAPDSIFANEAAGDLLESIAGTLAASLRETDLPAYIGNGVFAVLLVELKKRHAPVITGRLMDKIRKNTFFDLKINVRVECAFAAYTGGELKPYLDRLSEKVAK